MPAVVNIPVPKAFRFLTRKAPYKVLYGGRVSAKSWSVARVLLAMAAVRRLRILCARELQVSIRDSVHQLLVNQIYAMGLTACFAIYKKTIVSSCGSEFIFKGVRYNADEIKSTEGIDILWGEEAQRFSDQSWEILIPTIMRKKGAEIWITFNPDLEDDPTYQRFVVNTPPGALVKFVSYRDNPFFGKESEAERAYLQEVDPDAYMHVWEGHCNIRSEAQIFSGKWEIDRFVMPGNHDAAGPYYGADWGFSQDPTTLVRCWIHNDCLFIDYEAWGLRCALDDTGKLFDKVPGARDHTIRADSSRPETINHVKNLKNDDGRGFKIVGAPKWQGSVEDGITFLRSFRKIVIHERCTHMLEEAKLYKYKMDRLTGDVLPLIEDRHNHLWDAIRYALAPLIKKAPRWVPTSDSGRNGGEAGKNRADDEEQPFYPMH